MDGIVRMEELLGKIGICDISRNAVLKIRMMDSNVV